MRIIGRNIVNYRNLRDDKYASSAVQNRIWSVTAHTINVYSRELFSAVVDAQP